MEKVCVEASTWSIRVDVNVVVFCKYSAVNYIYIYICIENNHSLSVYIKWVESILVHD